MADIELIIRIPEEDYERIKNSDDMNFNVIKNGTPLPKGHGRLIDADKIDFDSSDFYDCDDVRIVEEIINDAPTIIEADKGE